MRLAFCDLFIKLIFLLFFSTLPVRAHELTPTIADLSTANSIVTLDMEINLEALLSGGDLDAVSDTDDMPQAATYDELRALQSGPLVLRTPKLLGRFNNLAILTADGKPVTLKSAQIDVPSGADLGVARISKWRLVGKIPRDTKVFEVNWMQGAGQIVLRQQGVEGAFTGLLKGGQSSGAIPIAGGVEPFDWGPLFELIPVGFEQIIPFGLDHILFIVALFLLSSSLISILWQFTMFTLAHSVALVLATFGFFTIPASILEPLIAASIVVVAVENLLVGHLSTTRPLLVFGLGLLHGFGFASGLIEYGLPEGQLIYGLIGFIIGIEAAQLVVIALITALIWGAMNVAQSVSLWEEEVAIREYPVMFRAISITSSIVIALVGVWWIIERVFL